MSLAYLNSVDRLSVAVNKNTLVNNYIPSGVGNSSDLIDLDLFNRFLAYLNLKIIAAIISCIAQSTKVCNNCHFGAENCFSERLPLENSKYSYRGNIFSDKVLLKFFIKNKHLIPQNKKFVATKKLDKLTGPLLVIPEEHKTSSPRRSYKSFEEIQIRLKTSQLSVICRKPLLQEITAADDERGQSDLRRNRHYKNRTTSGHSWKLYKKLPKRTSRER